MIMESSERTSKLRLSLKSNERPSKILERMRAPPKLIIFQINLCKKKRKQINLSNLIKVVDSLLRGFLGLEVIKRKMDPLKLLKRNQKT
jgi:hypothetical protein